ncbi:hypothetical protein BX661DRAFT_197993 [Kickxella alabastrina]|uniref:uncharacterized protein n=1 Tax=Kickxella alabastrina TaxID=61397 RepID=UPI00221E95A9|nr:uncharacterized protein BX661DRAFT_197993 [Kickxella alabastrina]KAI7829217.1 hypothetical protein BX661DRAFT_197993 [Kickxella alabastrina]KAJ1947742.1 hypothetical protein GGF37_000118 [Kickxella alabastrina]
MDAYISNNPFAGHRLQTANVQGLDNIIIPQPPPPPTANTTARNSEPRRVSAKHHQLTKEPVQQQAVAPRPWWMRLLVDAVFVPFVQGFMLNLGTHWVRNWRRNGGLLGVFRRRKQQ